jgi:hypothetical protein
VGRGTCLPARKEGDVVEVGSVLRRSRHDDADRCAEIARGLPDHFSADVRTGSATTSAPLPVDRPRGRVSCPYGQRTALARILRSRGRRAALGPFDDVPEHLVLRHPGGSGSATWFCSQSTVTR